MPLESSEGSNYATQTTIRRPTISEAPGGRAHTKEGYKLTRAVLGRLSILCSVVGLLFTKALSIETSELSRPDTFALSDHLQPGFHESGRG